MLMEAEGRYGDISLVSTQRARRPHAQMRRFGVRVSAAALAVLALAFVVMQGTRRSELESEGMKEYNLAQAKAVLASDEVELRNSKRRLKLIRDKLGGQQDGGSGTSLEEKGLSKVLLSKAEDYELQADVSAAKVAKETISNNKVPKLVKEESDIQEEDDKLYARALRNAADRNTASLQHVQHMHLYLQQYGSSTISLKAGELKEEKFLKTAEARMRIDRKNVELLLAAQAKHERPDNKVRPLTPLPAVLLVSKFQRHLPTHVHSQT